MIILSQSSTESGQVEELRSQEAYARAQLRVHAYFDVSLGFKQRTDPFSTKKKWLTFGTADPAKNVLELNPPTKDQVLRQSR